LLTTKSEDDLITSSDDPASLYTPHRAYSGVIGALFGANMFRTAKRKSSWQQKRIRTKLDIKSGDLDKFLVTSDSYNRELRD